MTQPGAPIGDLTPTQRAVCVTLAMVPPQIHLTPQDIVLRLPGFIPIGEVQTALKELRAAGLVERRKDYQRPIRGPWLRVYFLTPAGRRAVNSLVVRA